MSISNREIPAGEGAEGTGSAAFTGAQPASQGTVGWQSPMPRLVAGRSGSHHSPTSAAVPKDNAGPQSSIFSTAPVARTCSASQAMCFTSLPPAAAPPVPSMALSSARTWGSRAVMLVCRAVNQECAVAVSLQRRIRVFLLSGECSSISL